MLFANIFFFSFHICLGKILKKPEALAQTQRLGRVSAIDNSNLSLSLLKEYHSDIGLSVGTVHRLSYKYCLARIMCMVGK